MAQTPVVPLAGWPEIRSASQTGRDAEGPACVQVPRQEAATRVVQGRSSRSRVSTWTYLLWSMALLGLLLLPANYRAGAESAHAHSLIQLWTEANNGTVRHHVEHHRVHPSPGVSSSWFDPSVDVAGSTATVGLDDERPDAAEQQESAPVSSGVHLLLTVMMAIVTLGTCQVPIAVPHRRYSGLSPRILVPPPRWMTAAS
jgi:hypothetical protein